MRIAVLDVGGTALKYGIWTDGTLSQIGEKEYNAKLGAENLIALMKETLHTLKPFERIGISTAGLIDYDKGKVNFASDNIPGYTGTDLRKIMETEFSVPLCAENDVNCVAIAEAVYGAGAQYDSFICLAYGTGIGGAIIKDKKILHRGANYAAGEMGYTVTHAEDKIPGNFQSGVYESYGSTSALVKKAMEYDQSLSSGRKIFARMDEPKVKAIVDGWIKEIAIGLSGLIHVFDPPCVVLGGGIMAQKYIIDTLEKILPDYVMPLYTSVKLKKAQLGNDTALLGIGYLTQTMSRQENVKCL